MKADPRNLYRDMEYLTNTIGIRLAGSANEHAAAEYLRSRFLEYCPKCVIEEFPVQESRIDKVDLQMRMNGKWESFPAFSFNCAPTTEGRTLEAEVVLFDSHTDFQREDISFVAGKAVLMLGLDFPTEDDYRRMMETRPAFLMLVDTRHDGSVPLGDGLYPAFVQSYGALPTVNVAYFDAWKWLSGKADRAKLTISGRLAPSMSTNVVAELPGTDPNGKVIYFGGHHDTQAGTPGADDNAVGCAIVVELARLLSQKPHRNTMRLICFGAEEQLSMGSSAYVRMHRDEIEKNGLFMCNFDSCGSRLGWNTFDTNLNDDLSSGIREIFHKDDVWYMEERGLDPYNDLFPFTAAGLPGMALLRPNTETGLYYHHRADNNMDVIDAELTAKLTTAAYDVIEALDAGRLGCDISRDPRKNEEVNELWQSVFGGWKI